MDPDKSKWDELTSEERNWLIGEYLGVERANQFYLTLRGKRLWLTSYCRSNQAEAEETLARINGDGWKYFAKEKGFASEDKGHLGLELHEWHLRFTDTDMGAFRAFEEMSRRMSVRLRSLCAREQWEVEIGVHKRRGPFKETVTAIMRDFIQAA